MAADGKRLGVVGGLLAAMLSGGAWAEPQDAPSAPATRPWMSVQNSTPEVQAPRQELDTSELSAPSPIQGPMTMPEPSLRQTPRKARLLNPSDEAQDPQGTASPPPGSSGKASAPRLPGAQEPLLNVPAEAQDPPGSLSSPPAASGSSADMHENLRGGSAGGRDYVSTPDSASSARTIRVNHFVVEGNTLLQEADLRRYISPQEGKELTLAHMKELAKDVTTLYQRRGFYLTRAIIPKQAFDTDTVKILVVEGKIGDITVEGANHYDKDYIIERFKVAFPDGNFRSDDFQRAMILLNELPDLKVKAVMKAGKAVGTSDVVLQVEDHSPFHIGVDYNNYGTPETGENRVGLNLEGGNLITQADQLALRGVIGFPSRQNSFVQAQYQLPVNLDGTTVSASYANGAFAVSQGLGAILDVRGDADIFTLGVSHPLERQLDFASNLGFAVSHKNIRNNFFGGAFPFSRDEYTTARLTYQADWRGVSGRTILQAAYTQGLGGSDDALVSRLGATGGFSKFNFDLGRIQNFDTGLYGIVRASGQYATGPLYVAEQYAMGGPDTVRGYQQAELLGDNAYLLSAELRWSPIEDALDAFQMAFFIDHGGVSVRRRIPGDLPFGSSLTGAGLGFRFGIDDHATFRLDLGFPISPSDSRSGRNPAVYAGMQTRF